MTLLLEIECDGPRPLACLTHYGLVARVLREHGALADRSAWDVVRPMPRHPDWGHACRLVLAQEGRLVENVSPPDLVRLLEAEYARRWPEYRIRLHPVFDPNLVFPPVTMPRRRGVSLPPGALHALLNPEG